MTEYSRMAKGNFVSSGFAKVINLPFRPDFVELYNSTAIGTPAEHGVPFAWWDSSMGQGTAIEDVFDSSPALTTDVVSSNGISTFYAGLMLQYGPKQGHNLGSITEFSISKANPAVVTTVGDHGLQTGDVIVFQNLSQTATTGMQQIAGIPFMVTVTGATTFTICWNTNQSNYTAFNTATSTGNVGTYMKVLYPFLYFPGVSYICSITLGATTTIKTTDQHQMQVGQEVGFRIPTIWGTSQLNELPNVVIPGSPIYGYVVSVTDPQTLVVNIDSSLYTAFNSNQLFASYPGEFWPQIVAVGDVNTGGVQISAGSPLYPSPQYSFAALNDSSTINGPAIVGAYVNNTSQGFIIGSGVGDNDADSVLVGADGDVIFWRAFLHDLNQQTTTTFP